MCELTGAWNEKECERCKRGLMLVESCRQQVIHNSQKENQSKKLSKSSTISEPPMTWELSISKGIKIFQNILFFLFSFCPFQKKTPKINKPRILKAVLKIQMHYINLQST